MMVKHVFWNILRKKSECSFFQKISSKSKIPFFAKIFSSFSQISRKLLNIFFWLFLVPILKLLRHVLKKKFEKKIRNFSNKKISQLFFLFEKFKYSQNYSMFFPDSFWSPEKSPEDIFWNVPN